MFNYGEDASTISFSAMGRWRKLLDSEDKAWGGKGTKNGAEVISNGRVEMTIPPRNAVLFERAS